MQRQMRWMLFVDGENFTIRGQEFVKSLGAQLLEGPFYERDHFLWFPSGGSRVDYWRATDDINFGPRQGVPSAVRAYYFASALWEMEKGSPT